MATDSDEIVGRLPAISLTELNDRAGLQTRIDRKYVTSPSIIAGLIDSLVTAPGADVRALEIDGIRHFGYESVYFDTDDLESYRRAAHDRPNRFKVRTRRYLDSDLCVLEVKVKGCRGETVKRRIPYEIENQQCLTNDGREFVAGCIDLSGPLPRLIPMLTTRYRRSTVIDGDARITIDTGLACIGMTSGDVLALSDRVIVETKSGGAVTRFDRLLWAAGVRPISISKYAVGMAGLDHSLPANKWNQVLRRHIGWTPDHPRTTPTDVSRHGRTT